MRFREITEMVTIPMGRKGRATLQIPAVMYHSLRGREIDQKGNIKGYPLSHKEKELADLWVEPSPEGYVWLSPSALSGDAYAIDMHKLDPQNLRYTGQSEGYVLHKGPIPHNAIIRQLHHGHQEVQTPTAN